MELSRRSFIALGLGGALGSAFGAWHLATGNTLRVAPARALHHLSRDEFSILVALSNRVGPGHGDFPSAQELGVADKLDALMNRIHPEDVAELGLALRLLESPLAARALTGDRGTFTRLSDEEKDARMHAWLTHQREDLRAGMKAWVSLTRATYWADPRVAPLVGYEMLPLGGGHGR